MSLDQAIKVSEWRWMSGGSARHRLTRCSTGSARTLRSPAAPWARLGAGWVDRGRAVPKPSYCMGYGSAANPEQRERVETRVGPMRQCMCLLLLIGGALSSVVTAGTSSRLHGRLEWLDVGGGVGDARFILRSDEGESTAVHTSDDGKFEVDLPAAGVYRASSGIDIRGELCILPSVVNVSPGSDVRLVASRGSAIRLHLRDGETGKPIDGGKFILDEGLGAGPLDIRELLPRPGGRTRTIFAREGEQDIWIPLEGGATFVSGMVSAPGRERRNVVFSRELTRGVDLALDTVGDLTVELAPSNVVRGSQLLCVRRGGDSYHRQAWPDGNARTILTGLPCGKYWVALLGTGPAELERQAEVTITSGEMSRALLIDEERLGRQLLHVGLFIPAEWGSTEVIASVEHQVTPGVSVRTLEADIQVADGRGAIEIPKSRLSPGDLLVLRPFGYMHRLTGSELSDNAVHVQIPRPVRLRVRVRRDGGAAPDATIRWRWLGSTRPYLEYDGWGQAKASADGSAEIVVPEGQIVVAPVVDDRGAFYETEARHVSSMPQELPWIDIEPPRSVIVYFKLEGNLIPPDGITMDIQRYGTLDRVVESSGVGGIRLVNPPIGLFDGVITPPSGLSRKRVALEVQRNTESLFVELNRE